MLGFPEISFSAMPTRLSANGSPAHGGCPSPAITNPAICGSLVIHICWCARIAPAAKVAVMLPVISKSFPVTNRWF